MQKVRVEVGEKELQFDVDTSDYNSYINNIMPNDKVNPGWNMLVTTVTDEDKDQLKEIVLVDNVPNGFIVQELVAVIVGEVAGTVKINIKKPKGSAKK